MPWCIWASSPAIGSFYKEWAVAVALAFCGMLIPPSQATRAVSSHPITWVAGAIVAVLLLQCATQPSLWPKAIFLLFGACFLAFCIGVGAALQRLRPEATFDLLCLCLLTAALACSVFAGMQLAGLHRMLPFVLPPIDGRLSGNTGQANHFADVLWLGLVATAHLAAARRIGIALALPLVAVMQLFSVFSGSRTVYLYVALLAALGVVLWLRSEGRGSRRRFGIALCALTVAYGAVVAAIAFSGVGNWLGVASAEQRVRHVSSEARPWYWATGLEAAATHPLLGIGAGRLSGYSRDRSMVSADAPAAHGADAHAHNIFIQLASELGLPVAVFTLAATVYWLIAAGRLAWRRDDRLAALALVGVLLIHANLEHPLGYLYFLAIFGLLAAHLPVREKVVAAGSGRAAEASQGLRFMSFALLVILVVAYLQFDAVDKATRVVAAQVSVGQPPQPTAELAARLAAVPAWSPYRDHAETVSLIAAVPTPATAASLADRCENAVAYAATPFLLARCAVDLQVAGRSSRASNFANSLCRNEPESDRVLAQAMAFVEAYSPQAGDLVSNCVTRSTP